MNLSAALLGSAAGTVSPSRPSGSRPRSPEPHFFILGAKSYGRLNTFLLRTGYEQIDQLPLRASSERQESPDETLPNIAAAIPSFRWNPSAHSSSRQLCCPPSGSRPHMQPPRFRLITSDFRRRWRRLPSQGDVRVAIHQTISSGWHTYWRNPGDSGLATSLTWVLPKGVTAGDARWPTPERFTTGSIVNFGYSGDATLLVPLTVARDAVLPGAKAQAKLFLLECAQMCIPEQAILDIDLTHATGTSELFAKARAALPRQFHGTAQVTADAKHVTLTVPWRYHGSAARAFAKSSDVPVAWVRWIPRMACSGMRICAHSSRNSFACAFAPGSTASRATVAEPEVWRRRNSRNSQLSLSVNRSGVRPSCIPSRHTIHQISGERCRQTGIAGIAPIDLQPDEIV